MSLIKIDDLCAFYGKAQALSNVSLHVEPGETIAIVGANGAGKSTLLDCIMGLVKTTGQITLDGEDITGRKPGYMVRAGIGYAPERFNLFPHMTVRDNLLVGAYTARDDIDKNMEAVHRLFPRLAEREAQETSTQSGGERQMVSLGRALMSSPKILLVDEPTIGLAPKVCAEIAEVLKRLSAELGLTVIITEQNANFALSLASRLYVLEGGHVTATGTAEELAKDDQLAKSYFGA
ncbi:ABC-type transporter, ATPase subunit [Sulfitobacter noctilucicola]|uniref:Branched-chain amino acid transport system ATP-binding protein n=1 Tax=Sulfitobacter noctilucicola TaxID=1342301 RepID=A0A7W6MBR1_9RHOB|nr:ABC transporter ATP-binding protein [Sulfitobacter noctilucicola]KIN70240.1 ABC-type transporter, ATPase subunit [Sulfitobacter noctilucicola]MBB4176143.1 branched-chain amino acid transport system ATP-binding protein [Sulfitobacter noctilucicola]